MNYSKKEIETYKEKVLAEVRNNSLLPKKASKNPVVIALGGPPASGKSTVIKYLLKKLDAAIVSGDHIRHLLFSMGVKPFTFEREVVNHVREVLFSEYLESSYNIIRDSNTKPEQVKELTKRLEDTRYTLYSFYLNASIKTLKERILSRNQEGNKYMGQMNDLERAIPYLKKMNLDEYNYIIDTEKMSAKEAASFIMDKIAT